jgi:lipopolysaccharide biosynthesis glycosyltransferase
MNSDYALVVAVNEAYLPYAKQVFVAAKTQGGWNHDFVLIAHDIREELLEWFTQQNIRICRADKIIKDFSPRINKAHVWPEVVYAKLMLWHPFFQAWEKVLYLDVDTLIRGDLRPILENNQFSAREEALGMNLLYQFVPDLLYLNREHQAAIHTLNLDWKAPTFNVGVMLVPTKNNTQEDFDALVELANKLHGLAYFPEQAVLNAHFQHKWNPLPYVYNDLFVYEWYVPRRQPHEAVILHLVGQPKPWDENSPFHHEWQENMAKVDDFLNVKPQAKSVSKGQIEALQRRVKRWEWLGKLGRWWWKTKNALPKTLADER